MMKYDLVSNYQKLREIFGKTERIHISQIDPSPEDSDIERQNTEMLLDIVANSGTDGIILAGSSYVTQDKIKSLGFSIKKINPNIPILYGPSNYTQAKGPMLEQLLNSDPPYIDHLIIYEVFNPIPGQGQKFIVEDHKDWYVSHKSTGTQVPFDRKISVPYLFLNNTGTAAERLKPELPYKKEELEGDIPFGTNAYGYALHGIDMRGVIYFESTGKKDEIELNGNHNLPKIDIHKATLDILKLTRDSLYDTPYRNAILISGGNIKNANMARERKEAGANIVNVGGLIYTHPKNYLETVYAVKGEDKDLYQTHKKLMEKHGL